MTSIKYTLALFLMLFFWCLSGLTGSTLKDNQIVNKSNKQKAAVSLLVF